MERDRKPQFAIVKSEEYIANLNQLTKRYGRLVELNDAIEWALSRKPHYFDKVANDIYLWITQGLMSDDFPIVKIIYRIIEDKNTVVIITIEEHIE
jgi:hypothetical protein